MYYFTYWSIFIFVFLGIMLIILIVHQTEVSNTRKKQEQINLKADNAIKSSQFNITKIFYLNDCFTYDKSDNYKKFIAVDNDNKRIGLIDYEKGNLLIVEFSEILNYEIYENGSKATTGGSIGGFWSNIFGAETNEMCKDLKIIIRLKRYDISQISYEIISDTILNVGINKSTQQYKQCISTLQEVVSFLEVIKNENQANTKSTNE